MPNWMERFTKRARLVLSYAQEDAERLHHNTIGTEHLLLALLREGGGVGARVLRDLGLEERQLENVVVELTQAKNREMNAGLELSSGTKKVLELSVDEARRMGHHYIGTEHILLGIVRQTDGMAIDVLRRLGVSPDEVRRQVRRVLQESPIVPPPPPQSTETPLLSPSASSMVRLVHNRSFEILQVAVVQILDMVKEDKLTTTQAAELLGALGPYLTPSAGGKIRLIAQALRPTKLEDWKVNIVVRDTDADEVVLQTLLPLQKAVDNFDKVIETAISDDRGWIFIQDEDNHRRIEIRIEEAEE